MGGRDATLFDVDDVTGQIVVGSGTILDYESGITEYTVVVTATDESLEAATVAVTIMVEDVSLGTTGDRYDINFNESIDGNEVLMAVQDYFGGLISSEEILEVTRLYFDG